MARTPKPTAPLEAPREDSPAPSTRPTEALPVSFTVRRPHGAFAGEFTTLEEAEGVAAQHPGSTITPGY